MSPVTFDIRDPEFLTSPYTTYAELREHDPVHRTTIGYEDVWIVSRYEDVYGLFRSPLARMRPPDLESPPALSDGPASRMWRGTMSMMDPPDHERLRRFVSKAFTRRRAQEIRSRIQEIVNEALDEAADRGELEVMSEFALVVPMRVICGMLGIPEHDWDMLSSWTPDFLRMFVPSANTEEEMERCHRACQNFIDYFSTLVEHRRSEPAEDITSALVHAEEGTDRLSHDELVSTLRGLLTAGFETTMSTIGGAVFCLIKQPDQLDKLLAQPELIEGAVEEFLRWESPVQMQIRYFADDVELHGKTIRPGEKAMLLMGSANHDPDRYSNPDVADISRTGIDHLSFGGGIHHCCGAHLARLEVEVAVATLVQRFRKFDFATDSFPRRPHFQFRPIERLPITFESAA
jgi:cytochrome P450